MRARERCECLKGKYYHAYFDISLLTLLMKLKNKSMLNYKCEGNFIS